MHFLRLFTHSFRRPRFAPSFFLVEGLDDAANHATQELRQLDGVKPHATPPHRNYFPRYKTVMTILLTASSHIHFNEIRQDVFHFKNNKPAPMSANANRLYQTHGGAMYNKMVIPPTANRAPRTRRKAPPCRRR